MTERHSSEEFGQEIRAARERLGWSIRTLALRADVGRSTISRWEAGHAEPRPTELKLVRRALGLPDQKAAVDPVATLRRDLIRAVRVREGLSQRKAAEQAGVTTATLSRWESGDREPDAARGTAALRAMGATVDEVRALETGPARLDLDALPGQLEKLRTSVTESSQRKRDLEFLALRSALAGRSEPEAKRGAVELEASYIEWLGWWYRDAEATQRADRLLGKLDRWPDLPVWGRVLRASANGLVDFRNDLRGAEDVLERGLKRLRGQPSEAFVARELAGLRLQAGEVERARETLRLAAEIAPGEETPEGHRYCLAAVRASMLEQTGQADQALEIFPKEMPSDPYLYASSAIVQARLLRRVGLRDEASAELQRAVTFVRSKKLDHFETALLRHV